jgi:membrane protease YdiL (CAAX protease family)
METNLNIVLLACMSLFLLLNWAKFIKAESLFSERAEEGDWITVNGIQAISIAILFIPVLWDPNCLGDYLEISLPVSLMKSLGLLASMGAILIFIHYNSLQQSRLRFSNKQVTGVYQYIFLRITFIFIYEWFMRGLLLTTLVQRFGMVAGVIINLVIYTLLHSHKSKKEMMGCIPFGLLVCVLTIWWDSVWPAIILHLQLCLTYELPHLKKYFLNKKQATI